MPVGTLPNGIEVEISSDFEVAFLYDAIFATDSYLEHGLEVGDGDYVFDAQDDWRGLELQGIRMICARR